MKFDFKATCMASQAAFTKKIDQETQLILNVFISTSIFQNDQSVLFIILNYYSHANSNAFRYALTACHMLEDIRYS